MPSTWGSQVLPGKRQPLSQPLLSGEVCDDYIMFEESGTDAGRRIGNVFQGFLSAIGGGIFTALPKDARDVILSEAGDLEAPAQYKTPFAEPQADQHKLTTAEATFTMVNFCMNFGMFSVPLVFLESGLLGGISLIALAGFICFFTARLLGEVLETLAAQGVDRPSYGEAAFAAGGRGFETLMRFVCLAEVGVYAVGSQILIGHTLADLLGLSFVGVTLASICLTMICHAIPDKPYSYFSLLGAVCLMATCMVIVASGWELPEWAQADVMVGEPNQWAPSFSVLIFGAALHPCLPLIFNGVQTRAEYETAARNGWGFWALCCVAVGVPACYMFGPALQVIATRNVGRDLSMHTLEAARSLATLSAVGVVLKVQLSSVPSTRPLVEGWARVVGVELPQGNGGMKCVMLAVPILAAIGLGAFFLQEQIKMLESLAAIFLMGMNAFIFPGLAYLCVCQPQRLRDVMKGVFAVVFGAVFAASVGLSYVL